MLTYLVQSGGRFFTKSNVRGYCFGFNGQMKDDEVYGEANSYTAEYWQYDPRLGRRWNLDPVLRISESGYSCFRNSPIALIDPEGNTDYYNTSGEKIGTDGNENNQVMIVLNTADATSIKSSTDKKQWETIFKSVVPLPSKDELDAMDDAWDNTLKSMRGLGDSGGQEQGFWGGEGEITTITPGQKFQLPKTGKLSGDEVKKAFNSRSKAGKLLVHTHVPVYLRSEGRFYFSDLKVSDQDEELAEVWEKRVGKNITFAIIGGEYIYSDQPGSEEQFVSKKPVVNYFDKEGSKGTISLKDLKGLAKKINQQKNN